MANPNPQHNPTDGLGVAAYVVLSGGTGTSALSNPSGGNLGHPGTQGTNGQGIGATEGGSTSVATAPGFPSAQYAITLSLSAAGTYETAAVLTAALVDVKNNSYSPVGNFTAYSYNNPAAGSPAWYKPSNFAGYSADVCSAAASSTNDATITITGLHLGTGIVEVAFPTFDNTIGTDTQAEDEPTMFIYVQVIVTVIP
jgi:hypothetical protein